MIEFGDGTRRVGEIVRSDSEFVWVKIADRIQRFERTEIRKVIDSDTEREKDADDVETPPTEQDTAQESADDAAREEAARREAVKQRVVQFLERGTPEARVAAQQELTLGWPISAEALDATLSHEDTRVRCDAIRVLTDERLGDQTDRLLAATRDEAVKVRLLAVRQFRRDARYSRNRKHDRRSDVEERLTEILSRESAWPVVQEALRTLETVGTLERLTVVLDGYVFTEDEHRRRRYRRTLAAVLGRDLGKDADDDAWGEAISAAREARRRAR